MEHNMNWEWRLDALKRVEKLARETLYDIEHYENISDEKLYNVLVAIQNETYGIDEEDV